MDPYTPDEPDMLPRIFFYSLEHLFCFAYGSFPCFIWLSAFPLDPDLAKVRQETCRAEDGRAPFQPDR